MFKWFRMPSRQQLERRIQTLEYELEMERILNRSGKTLADVNKAIYLFERAADDFTRS